VSFIDGHRQWYKSAEGVLNKEVPKENTFCKYVIADEKPLVVPDATKDPRFRQNTFVVNDPHLRFYAGIPLKTADGHSIGVFCILDTAPRDFNEAEIEVMQDLAQMVMGALELRLVANKDGLTGTMSRCAFKEELERTIALALRHGDDASVITFDIDLFKAINDTHGHQVGDQVLCKTVQACVSQLRTTDLIGRLGGEEFAVLLPNTGQASAMRVAEKLRAAIERQRLPIKERMVKLTASFGVASLDPATRDADTLLERADEALYEAKAAGRNRCVAPTRPHEQTDPARRRVLKAGQILFNGRSSTINCTVRSLSDQGAGIEVSNSTGIPSRFDLVIKSDRMEKPCRIVSQSERQIDVVFC
jgi:diguanylate cyclase (GGDEF)-like protein